MKLPIYLDHHATTPVDPRVFEVMRPYFTEIFGNPSSRTHSFGWQAEEGVEHARGHVAELIGAAPSEIIFTSGATEANNLAIKGTVEACATKRRHIITVATEHRSVLDTCQRLAKAGTRITILPVRPDGLINLDQLQAAISDETLLISVMYANNEIGVLQPIAEIGKIAAESGVLFHSDAAQAAGKVPVSVVQDQIDLLSMSAHKMYGPKGVGALCVRRRDPRVPLLAQMDGGGHERGLRPGTLNVPGIVGFGAACAIARSEMREESRRLAVLRDRLKDRLMAELDACWINGCMNHRLPGNLNINFTGVDGEALLTGLNDLAVSSGSACKSSGKQPSHVLKALGVPDESAHATLRFGLGRFTTAADMDHAAEKTISMVKRLRATL